MSSPENTPVITARNLEKTFRDFWWRPKVRAVKGISFDVRRGEVFGLLGPNGSGKSTTIKMLLGLLRPTGGTIEVLGKPPKHIQTKHHIGYLPEESYLYPYLTAEESLRFYGKLFNLQGKELETRVDRLLEQVDLVHARRRRIGEFSKGMARRVGLAQALVNEPDLIILDEPTSGLDPIGTREVKDLVLKLAEEGRSVLLCSHLLADVEDVCSRVAILYQGRIETAGTVRELLEEKSRCRLTFNEPEKQILQQLVDEVKTRSGSDVSIDRPQHNLEEIFLRVIQEAEKKKGRN